MKTVSVKANRDVTVTYLGVFYEGEERELTEYEVGFYEFSTGLPLSQDNMPEGVELTITDLKKPTKAQKPQTEGSQN
jgi:hypothetical protein